MKFRAMTTDARLAALTWIVMAIGVSTDFAVTGFTNEPNRTAVSLFCMVFFAILVLRLVLALRAKRRGRLTLGALMTALVLWAVESTLLQSSQDGGHGEHLAAGEWAYLLTYLIFVVYLLLDAEHGPARAMTTWLETAVICAGSASLAGTLLLTPLANGKPEAVPLLVALVYPVADVVLALLVMAQVGLRMRATNRKSVQLGLGFLLLGGADATFVGNVLHGSAGSSVVAIVLWGAGFAQLVSAAARRIPEEAIAPTGELPSSILVTATLAAIGVLAIRPDGRLGVYLGTAAVLTLLAAGARMFLALRDARRAAEELVLARTDALTKLPNRRGVLLRIDEDLAAGAPIALMIMDLNGFKEINDALGHSIGDIILQMCGRRLREAMGPEVLVARLGGDEFALVVPDVDEIRLLERANIALAAVREPTLAHGIELMVGASTGIAVGEEGDADSSALLRRADVAMYQAKRIGAGAVIYEAANDEFSRDRLRLVEELRRGIMEGQLVLYYQPKLHAATQRICGVEALVRWEHPKQGILPPGAFLPAARHAGLMPALSEAVIRRAAEDLKSWRGTELGFPVSLNCPPPELLSGVFVRQLLSVIADTDLRPSNFCIEVTEDSFVDDPERARDIVADLRNQGLEVSIDDYGVGFSSLAYLRDLPIDELKMDRSFVSNMITDERTRKIVESTIKMAHALDLRVVAEGVEDAPTAAMLVALGADALQGYHFSRPIPADQFIVWVREWRNSLANMQV
jgi:diguanylate cyclase (GGDEF)-like protein